MSLSRLNYICQWPSISCVLSYMIWVWFPTIFHKKKETDRIIFLQAHGVSSSPQTLSAGCMKNHANMFRSDWRGQGNSLILEHWRWWRPRCQDTDEQSPSWRTWWHGNWSWILMSTSPLSASWQLKGKTESGGYCWSWTNILYVCVDGSLIPQLEKTCHYYVLSVFPHN